MRISQSTGLGLARLIATLLSLGILSAPLSNARAQELLPTTDASFAPRLAPDLVLHMASESAITTPALEGVDPFRLPRRRARGTAALGIDLLVPGLIALTMGTATCHEPEFQNLNGLLATGVALSAVGLGLLIYGIVRLTRMPRNRHTERAQHVAGVGSLAGILMTTFVGGLGASALVGCVSS